MDALESQMRAVLLELELTSSGRTASYNSAGGGDSSGLPPLGQVAPHDYWRRRWDAAVDDERAATLKGARDELNQIRHATAPRKLVPESRGELHERIVRDGEGFPVKEVAASLRCLTRTVVAARLEAGREPKYGRTVKQPATADERVAEVRRLAAEGVTPAQIGVVLSVGYKTVRRDLGRL
jgi:hypothetical protein